jgi:hypothetical protein
MTHLKFAVCGALTFLMGIFFQWGHYDYVSNERDVLERELKRARSVIAENEAIMNNHRLEIDRCTMNYGTIYRLQMDRDACLVSRAREHDAKNQIK